MTKGLFIKKKYKWEHNNKITIHRQQIQTELLGKNDKPTVKVEYYITVLLIDREKWTQFSKNVDKVSNTINQLTITSIYRILYPITVQILFMCT